MLFLRFFCIAVAIEKKKKNPRLCKNTTEHMYHDCLYSDTIQQYLGDTDPIVSDGGKKSADTSRKPHGAIERLCATSTSLRALNGSLPWLQTHHSQNSEKGNTSGVEALQWPAALICCNGCLRGRKRRRRRRRGKRRKKKHNSTKDPIFTGSLIAVGRVIAGTDD